MIIRINKHFRFCTLLTVLMLLILARYAFRLEIPRIVLTAIIIFLAVLGDRDEILAVCMSCIPLHNAIDFYTAIIICVLIYILKNPKHFRFDAAMVIVPVMIAYELLHCLTADFSFKLFLVDIAPLVVLMVIIGVDLRNINYAFVVRTMAICSICVCMVLLANLIIRADGNLVTAFLNLRRLGVLSDDETLLGGAINPNSIGVINLLAATALMQLSIHAKQKIIDVFLILLLLVLGMITLSRTFLVCLILMVFLWIMGQPERINHKAKSIIRIIFIAGLSIFLMAVLFPNALENYIMRFQTDDITSGRDIIMKQYQNYIKDNINILLFGVGLNNFTEKVTSIYAISIHTPHNSIQEIIVAWGIPGCILVTLLFAMIISESKRYGIRKNLINFIPLLIILAKSMAGQLITSGYTIMTLAFAYLSLCQDFQQIKTPVWGHSRIAVK